MDIDRLTNMIERVDEYFGGKVRDLEKQIKELNSQLEEMKKREEEMKKNEIAWLDQVCYFKDIQSASIHDNVILVPNENKKGFTEFPFEFLNKFSGLIRLDISDNNITNLNFLKFCPNLKYIHLDNCENLVYIFALTKLPYLEEVKINYLPIVDLKPLKNCKLLKNII